MSNDNINNIDSLLVNLENDSQKLTDKLTVISEKIKRVENALQTLNIGIDVSMEFQAQPLSSDERTAVTERIVPDWQFINAYAKDGIRWARNEQSGKFRLLYTRTIYEDRISLGYGDAPKGTYSTSAYGCAQYPDGVTVTKPLIECSIDVRLRLWPELPAFLAKLHGAIEKIISVEKISINGGF